MRHKVAVFIIILAAFGLFAVRHAHAGLGPGYPPLPDAPASTH